MKSSAPVILLLATMTLAAAQSASPLVSPEIAAGQVTFRLRAAGAAEVHLRGQWQRDPLPLVRDEDGVWSAQVSAIPAGIWEYGFAVDGLNVIDPANPALKPQREPQRSILHLPAEPPAPWDWQDVPHGSVHQHGYQSRALHRARELRVYTPPGYEQDATSRYPLLILQHGAGDDHRTWVEHGKAHWILDHLIARQRALPMIVLMLDGHPLGPWPRNDAARRAQAIEAFQRELFEDALPLIESLYRVESDRARRGIAGLSMGGAQALTTAFTHLDRFAWVASFSGAPPEQAIVEQTLANAEAFNAQIRLLWLAIGKDDFLLPMNEPFVELLRKHGLRHEWHLTAGDHSWPVWRRHLVDLAPRLFREVAR